jgi:hypothetical protein
LLTPGRQYEVSPEMASLPAKVIALEKLGCQYQVIVQISTKSEARFTLLLLEKSNPTAALLRKADWT